MHENGGFIASSAASERQRSCLPPRFESDAAAQRRAAQQPLQAQLQRARARSCPPIQCAARALPTRLQKTPCRQLIEDSSEEVVAAQRIHSNLRPKQRTVSVSRARRLMRFSSRGSYWPSQHSNATKRPRRGCQSGRRRRCWRERALQAPVHPSTAEKARACHKFAGEVGYAPAQLRQPAPGCSRRARAPAPLCSRELGGRSRKPPFGKEICLIPRL
jgi:hypothetical protein